jgi:hypothetical protein
MTLQSTELTLSRTVFGSANFQQQFCCETQMHLTCTNIDEATVIEALHKAKASGITNILALRGDPPAGTDKWEATEGGCNNAVDLVPPCLHPSSPSLDYRVTSSETAPSLGPRQDPRYSPTVGS